MALKRGAGRTGFGNEVGEFGGWFCEETWWVGTLELMMYVVVGTEYSVALGS